MPLTSQFGPPRLGQRTGRASVSAVLLLAAFALPRPAQADVLYIANNGNSTLTKLDEKGGLSVVTSNVSGACGVAYDYAGRLNVLNLENGRLYSVTKEGNVTEVGNGLTRPEDLAINSRGEIFVANGDGTIRRFEPNLNTPNVYVTGLNGPHGIAIDKNDNLYVSNYGDGTIAKITHSPAGQPIISTLASGLYGPATLAFGPEGNLYVATLGDKSIVKVSPKGVITPFAKNVGTPTQVAFDSHGALYTLDATAGTVLTFDKTGGFKVFAQGLSRPYGMAFDHPLNRPFSATAPALSLTPKLNPAIIIALCAPAILIFIGGVLWLVLRKKDAE